MSHSRFSFAVFGLAAIAAAASSASAASSSWTLRVPVQLQVWRDATSSFDVVADLGTTNTQILNGITIGNSTVYSISGQQYFDLSVGTNSGNPGSNDRGLRLIGITNGVLNQPYNNVTDRIQTNFLTNFTFNGAGTVNLFNVNSGYGLFGPSDSYLQQVGSSGGTGVYSAGNNPDSFQYVDNFGGSDANLGVRIVGDFEVGFEWTGYALTDVLQFSLPNTGVTIQQTVVPEPATMAVLLPVA